MSQHVITDLTTKEAETELVEMMRRIAEERCKPSYERLFRSLAPRLLSYARNQRLDEAMALELVQETMLKLWLKCHLYDLSKGAPMNWIFSVARNVKFDLLRRNKHVQEWVQGDDLWPTMQEPEVDTASGKLPKEFAALVGDELSRVLETLPPEQADVVRRVYLHGSSQQEVSDLLDLPLGTVKSRLRLALKKMKEVLDV